MKPLFFLKRSKSVPAICFAIGLCFFVAASAAAQTKSATATPKKNITQAKSSANKKAEFKGGEAKLADYLKKNLRYPADPKKKNLSGIVTVRFVIEMDGNVNELQVVKGLGGDYDVEALRLLRDSPKWDPAVQNGQPVRSYLTLPIKFAPTAK